MKVFKVLVALVLSFALLCAQGLIMSGFACDKSFSPKAVTKAIQETNFTQELYQQTLKNSNANSNEQVQEFLQKALQTDTASQLVGRYASSAIGSVLYGQEFTRFTKKDLMDLTSDSLEELDKSTGGMLTDKQKQAALGYVRANGNALVDEINKTLPVLEQTASLDNEEMAAIAKAQRLLSAPVRAALGGTCLILGIILIALFWRSRLGFLWWAAISVLLGAVFLFLGTSSDFLTSYIQDSGEGTTFALLLTGMFSQGLTLVGYVAIGLALFLVLLCLMGRKLASRTAKRYDHTEG